MDLGVKLQRVIAFEKQRNRNDANVIELEHEYTAALSGCQ
jgi:hypothetical protein